MVRQEPQQPLCTIMLRAFLALLSRDEAQDLPHVVLHARDPRARHLAVERAIRAFSRAETPLTPASEIRRARATVVVPDTRESVDIEYSSCPRALRVDVATNVRSKNRSVALSASTAEGVLAFVRESTACHDIRFARRMVVVENLDMLPLEVQRGFERVMERATTTSWLLLSVASLSGLGNPIVGRCFAVNANTNAHTNTNAGGAGGGGDEGDREGNREGDREGGEGNGEEDATRTNLQEKRSRDAREAPASVRQLVSKAMRAQSCRTLVPVKVPRCVSALGAHGVLSEVARAVLEEAAPRADRGATCAAAAQSLVSRLATVDRTRVLAMNTGNIADNDDAFVDALLTNALLHVRRYAVDAAAGHK